MSLKQHLDTLKETIDEKLTKVNSLNLLFIILFDIYI